MYQFKGLEDTIVAISTAMGQGGIGIIRLSGRDALGIADSIFILKSRKKASESRSQTVHYGWVVHFSKGNRKKERIIDEALLTVMRAPRSYTREDIVEISCHGGMASLKAILNEAIEAGARLAEPGEFTKRAFLNGRIDLAQAEAVLDIIQAKTDAFLQVSVNQLKGDLSTELESIREILLNVYVEIEAYVNFPEDDINIMEKKKLIEKMNSANERVSRLLVLSEQGRILKEGIRIVICGRPNVGKSSLLNVFLKQPRAIVSEIAGTTRDTIEETASIKGIPFQFIDTAGILNPRDSIEEEAVLRSRQSIQMADLVLFVLDASQSLSPQDKELTVNIQGKDTLVVLNKSDLENRMDLSEIDILFPHAKKIKVSALQRTGIEDLESLIVNCVWQGKLEGNHGLLISNMRHIEALKNCRDCLEKMKERFQQGLSLEFISEDIKTSVNFLDNITGRNIDSDLLDSIFSQFCIGK